MLKRSCFEVWFVLTFLLISIGSLDCYAQAGQNAGVLKFSSLKLSAKADLGNATFQFKFTTSNRSDNVGMQLFVKRNDVKTSDQYDLIAPVNADGSPLILQLFKGLERSGNFTLPLPKGEYGAVRLLLFQSSDGKSPDYAKPLYDSAKDPANSNIDLKLKIVTSQKRVTSLTLDLKNKKVVMKPLPDGSSDVSISATLKLPKSIKNQGNGYYVMAKGSAGFSQIWASLADATPGGDPLDDYYKIPLTFDIKGVKPGVSSLDFGVFPQNFEKPLQWITNGADLEVGGDSWVEKAPADRIPPRLMVKNQKFQTVSGKPYDFYSDQLSARKAVSFVRGGNYGNAVVWTINPLLNSPGYFTLLGEIGCKYLRFCFNPDRYLAEPMYRHVVDQIVQNIWAARLYPLLCPQDLPAGDTLAERVSKGKKVAELMATIYKGKSVWLEIVNEPSQYHSWKDWKPTATQFVKAVRAIDPDAFVVVPFEDFSKDGRGAAKDPITETRVDLYDGHAYIKAEEVSERFQSAITAGLPVLIGEYGGAGGQYLSDMNRAIQNLKGSLLASGPWAFTILGQDSLPLVQDGSSAVLKMTPAGQAVRDDYAFWDAGKRLEK